ncbi:hypothetical protein M758_12G001500 [Ceratodon purpureus]|uniref:Uncharacterized protein n=1 Tax=Ceratodon purpureus TaxID=3225 RepID=A0A8T0G665_CERPU|nr:hypothetical protein KC19_12G004100 [Ceratodon purpureus]KAG0597522.1 hypothetical protein M758_12G001500 [Ceratodon purpureus]
MLWRICLQFTFSSIILHHFLQKSLCSTCFNQDFFKTAIILLGDFTVTIYSDLESK